MTHQTKRKLHSLKTNTHTLYATGFLKKIMFGSSTKGISATIFGNGRSGASYYYRYEAKVTSLKRSESRT